MIKRILFVALLLSFFGLQAQVIVPRVLILPPYPQNMQDLLTRQFENVIELQNTSAMQQNVQLQFRAYCEENGVSARTTPGTKSPTPLVVPPGGLLRLNGMQLSELFTGSNITYTGISLDDVIKKRAVPEGYYFICVQAFDYTTGAQLSSEVCSNPISMMAIEPPTLRVSNPMQVDTILNPTPQNIIFQWNTPSNLRADALASMQYKLKIIEVPEGIDPNQAMLAAPAFSPEYTVTNTNFFLYGTNLTPLTIGRRYAALVRIIDPLNRFNFRNNGNSEVISFVFGGAKYNGGGGGGTGRPPATRDTARRLTGAKYISGSVFWAFKLAQEKPEPGAPPLIGAQAGENSSTTIMVSNNPGNNKEALADAVVSLYGLLRLGNTNYRMLIRTGKTNKSGSFSLDVSNLAVSDFSAFELEVNHPNNGFNRIRQAVPLSAMKSGSRLADIVLSAQTFELGLRVQCPQIQQGDAAVVRLLMPRAVFDFLGVVRSLGQVSYNNQPYVVVAEFNNGGLNKQLFYPPSPGIPYVLQLNYNKLSPVYYALQVNEPVTDARNGIKTVNRIRRNLFFKPAITVSGTVRYENAGRRDVRVTLTVRRADMVTPSTQETFIANTDINGRYTFLNLPLLRNGSRISLSFTDRGIRRDPFTSEITFNGVSPIVRDMNLVSDDYCTVVGRVMDGNRPVDRGLVTIPGTPVSVFTDNRGFFQLKTAFPLRGQIRIQAEGLKDQFLSAGSFRIISCENNSNAWSAALLSAEAVRSLRLTNPSGNDLGLGTGSIASRFELIFTSTQTVKAVLDGAAIIMEPQPCTLTLRIMLNNSPVRARVSFNEREFQPVQAAPTTFSLNRGYYQFYVTPAPEGPDFLPFAADVSFDRNGSRRELTFSVKPAVKIRGMVRDKTNGNGIPGEVYAEGTPLRTKTNNSGAYELFIEPSTQYRLFAAASGYYSFDTQVRISNATVLNFNLVQRAPGVPDIRTLGGFKVKIDQLEKDARENTYIVNGSITLSGNDRISTDAVNKVLHFRRARIVAGPDDTNALPELDLLFEEATLPILFYNYAPGEILGLPQIMMRRAVTPDSRVTYAVIGGNQLVARFSNIKRVASYLPVGLRDAVVNDEQLAQGLAETNINLKTYQYFKYAFITPGVRLNLLNRNRRFKLVFVDRHWDFSHQGYFDTTRTRRKEDLYVEAAIRPFFDFFINRYDDLMTNDAIMLDGLLKLKKVLATKLKDTVGYKLTRFWIGREFQLQSLTVDISERKPAKISLQKFEARLTSITIDGLGTNNVGVGFGGTLNLTKVQGTDSFDARKAWIINNFKLTNSPGGISVYANFSLPAAGFELKKLVFKTPQGKFIDMTLIPQAPSYELRAMGDISYKRGSNESGVAGNVFPIAIELFKLRTQDWSLFMAARANIRIDFKAVSISISKLLVAVGSDMTIDRMNDFLVTGLVKLTPVTKPYEVEDERVTAWAIGIEGGVSFPLKGMECSGKASLLLAQSDGDLLFRLNELCIAATSPAKTFKACARFRYTGPKRGFEGEGELTTLQRGFACTFKYYSLEAGGHEFGASIKTTTEIVTGPIVWHSIGGGFDFNTGTKRYNVFFTGDLGPAGTPKQTAYLRDARISITFVGGSCSYSPVIEGSGFFNQATKDVGHCGLKLDFCRKLVMMTLMSTYNISDFYKIELTGLGFGMTETVDGKERGSFFLAANTNLKTIGDIAKGNAFFAVGVFHRNYRPNVPAEVTNQYNRIDRAALVPTNDLSGSNRVCRPEIRLRRVGRNRVPYVENVCVTISTYHSMFHGVYISAEMGIPRKRGAVRINMKDFDAFNFNYDFFASGKVDLWLKFTDGTGGIRGALNVNASASLYVFGVGLSGAAFANASITGGRDNAGWYSRGSCNLGLEMYNNNSAGCNSVKVGWQPSCCTNWPYPCPTWRKPWRTCRKHACICGWPTFAFKVCKSLSASFEAREKQETKTTVNVF